MTQIKNIALIIFFCSLAGFASSQINIGLKIGYNLDYFDFEPEASFSSFADVNHFYTGAHMGYALSYTLPNQRLMFSQELQGKMTGNIKRPLNLWIGDLQLPLIATFFINQKFGLELGTQLNFDFASYHRNQNGSWSTRRVKENQVDYGIATGIRYKILDELHLTSRLYVGLKEVNGYGQYYVRQQYNRSLQLSLIFSGWDWL